MTQTVTLPRDYAISNARNYKGEKFLTHSLKLLAIGIEIGLDASIHELAELCVWTSNSPNASKYYASLWIHSNPYWISGHGTAGGYGYCKASAASARAFESAGIRLSRNIDGAGMPEVESALYALGEALVHYQKTLYVVRGA